MKWMWMNVTRWVQAQNWSAYFKTIYSYVGNSALWNYPEVWNPGILRVPPAFLNRPLRRDHRSHLLGRPRPPELGWPKSDAFQDLNASGYTLHLSMSHSDAHTASIYLQESREVSNARLIHVKRHRWLFLEGPNSKLHRDPFDMKRFESSSSGFSSGVSSLPHSICLGAPIDQQQVQHSIVSSAYSTQHL